MKRNGTDVTSAFSEQDGALVGLVTACGSARTSSRSRSGTSNKVLGTLKLTNYPITGPIFSGPHQQFFVCNTIQAGLGEPLVDNQDGQGFRVQNPDGSTAGWSLNCSANTASTTCTARPAAVPAAAQRRLASVRTWRRRR